jgi:hypothetical protein
LTSCLGRINRNAAAAAIAIGIIRRANNPYNPLLLPLSVAGVLNAMGDKPVVVPVDPPPVVGAGDEITATV